MNALGGMVNLAEVEAHFRDAPDDVVDWIEMLGNEMDVRLAQRLPFRGRVGVLWDVLQRTLKSADT